MEGAAVGAVCYRNEVPFAILRCISDDYNSKESVDYYEFRNIAAERSIKAIMEFLRL